MGVDSCVCVTNIPTDATESELYSHFSSVGNIEAVLMENIPKTNTFSGTAFIVYEEMTSAADAPVKLDTKMFKGAALAVAIVNSDQFDQVAILLGRHRLNVTGTSNKTDNENQLVDKQAEQLSTISDDQILKLFMKLSQSRNIDLTKHSKPFSFPPKLPSFSGDKVEKGKTDSTYNQWRYQVKSLADDKLHTSQEIMTSVRHSLKGTAFDVLQGLGNNITPDDVIDTFDHIFGNVFPHRQLLNQFNATQKDMSETVVSWGCRLRKLMTQIKESHPMPESECEEMLRYQFYFGLNDDKLVTALRHRYDDGNSFDELFTYARKVEFEFSQKSRMIFRDKKPSVAQQTSDSEKLVLQKIGEITQKLATIDSRLAKVESQKLPVRRQKNQNKDSQGNSKLKCTRCFRTGHDLSMCHANWDIYGKRLN